VEPEAIPPVRADTQKTWTGPLPDFPGMEIRIEAAVWQGKPVPWRIVVLSWDHYSIASLPSEQLPPGTGNMVLAIVTGALIVMLFVAGPAFFARRRWPGAQVGWNSAFRSSI
jgi:hypothetical protein